MSIDVHNLGTLYRPTSFRDLVHPSPSVVALANMVARGEVPQAIVLSGPYGCGKTTIASILARVLLCKDPHNGIPCGVCSACQVPLASNSDYQYKNSRSIGVAEARDLIEAVKFRPRISAHRVTDLDEAHTLTPGAQSQLLIPVETPPAPHIVWIFSSNHVSGMLPELLSRCMHVRTELPTLEDILVLLTRVVAAEGMTVSQEVLSEIARASGYHYRDALHMLHCGSSAGAFTDVSSVSSFVSKSPSRVAADTLRAIVCGKPAEALSCASKSDEYRIIIKTLMLYASKLAVYFASGVGLQAYEIADYERIVQGVPRQIWTSLFLQFLPALETLCEKLQTFAVDESVLLNDFVLRWSVAFSQALRETAVHGTP